MTDLEKTRENPEEQFWEVLGQVHAVMLGSPNPAEHLQPMSPLPAPEDREIWFFARNDSDIGKAAAEGGRVHLCVVGKEHDYHACLIGDLKEQHSEEHVERFWSPLVDAWFEGGKSDPALTMLRFRPREAAIWASVGSRSRFTREVLSAEFSHKDPKVGVTTRIRFTE